MYQIRRYRFTHSKKRRGQRIWLIVDAGKRTVDWAWSEIEARRKLAALQEQQRKAAA